MGGVVCRALRAADGVELAAEVGSGDPLSRLSDARVEVAVDFTRPEAVMDNLRWCVERGIHVVAGADVLPESNLDLIRGWLARPPGVGVLVAPGFSTAATLALHLTRLAARHFDSAAVVERHHAGKRDAPASPAVHMARAVGRDTAVHAVRVPGVFSRIDVVLTRPGEAFTIRLVELDRSCIPPAVLRAVRAVPHTPGLTVGVSALLGLSADDRSGPPESEGDR
jgi:4-hydroxy-tetrahydrodipicolinate reductase